MSNVKRQTPNEFFLGISPCPNDTFIFDALVNGKIDTEGLNFNVRLEDVQTLNRMAMNGELDITKISFAAYALVKEQYELLTSGGALGKGVGPLFISNKVFSDPSREIKTIAIPGFNTTAYFLFRMFYPQLKNMKEMIFSDIENALLNDEVDAGIIIHENRFTYQEKGLKKISDLGELWEHKTGKPIPLGGIAIKRNLDDKVKHQINGLVKKSIEYAFANPGSSSEYVRLNAQEMSEEVRKKHIQLYVNSYSLDIGPDGREAVSYLLEMGLKSNTDLSGMNIFID